MFTGRFINPPISRIDVRLIGWDRNLIYSRERNYLNRDALGKVSIVLILLSSMLVRSLGIPLVVAYTLASISYSLFILYAFKMNCLKISVTTKSAILITIIYLIIITNILITPIQGEYTISPLIRGTLIITFTSLNLYLIPQQLNSHDFFSVLSRISAITVLISLPTAILDSYSIFGYTIYAYEWNFNLPIPLFSNQIINPIQGPFNQPNIFGFVTSIALMGSLGEFRSQQTKLLPTLLVLLNFLGSYLSGSRAAFLFSIIGATMFFIYPRIGPAVARLSSTLLLLSVIIFTIIYSGIIPLPDQLPFVNLEGRRGLWATAVEAIKTRPIIGFGPGDQVDHLRPFYNGIRAQSTHNSFLRMFLTTGIVGGVSYILLTYHAMISSVSNIETDAQSSVAAAIIVLVLHQTFAGFAIFASVGVSVYAVISAVVFGYAIRQVID